MLGSAPTAKERQEQRLREQAEQALDTEVRFRLDVVEAAKHARFNVGTERKALRDLIAVIDAAEARCVAGAMTEELKAA